MSTTPVTPALPVSRLINVSVNLTPSAAQSQSTSTLLILGSSSVIDVKSRLRQYTSINQVAADFGSSAPEYLAAVLWFEQSPQPPLLLIGRWAQTPTPGRLFGGPVGSLGSIQAISLGGFTITIDATVKNLAALNFSAASSFNAVASIIQTGLGASATCVYNSVYNRFEITSATTGATSLVSFATPPGTGTDASHVLGLGSTDGGYQANGMVAETALAAVTLFDSQFGQQWYAVTVLGAVTADHQAIAPYIEAGNNKHLYGVSTLDANTLNPGSITDVAYLLSQLKFNKTTVQYSSSNPYAVVSLLARILTTDYTANNSVITLMYKQEPGIIAETLNTTQIAAVEAKNCNVFVNYDNSTAIIEPGVASSGQFLDTVIGTDVLAITIQTALYNDLYTTTTKIPQTDAGMHILTTTVEQVCSQFVQNGQLAPGIWNQAGFGALDQGDFMSKGYYVFAPPISTQSQANRSSRMSVPIQVAAKLAGAIHTVNVIVTVNP
jgi:hypothetical protein